MHREGGAKPVKEEDLEWKLEERNMVVARHDLHVHTLQRRLSSAKGCATCWLLVLRLREN